MSKRLRAIELAGKNATVCALIDEEIVRCIDLVYRSFEVFSILLDLSSYSY